MPFQIRAGGKDVFVQRPVKTGGKGNAVAGIIVARFGERDQVCGLDHDRTIGQDHPPARGCAAVIVGFTHHARKSRIADFVAVGVADSAAFPVLSGCFHIQLSAALLRQPCGSVRGLQKTTGRSEFAGEFRVRGEEDQAEQIIIKKSIFDIFSYL